MKKRFFLFITIILLGACSTGGTLKKIKIDEPQNLEVAIIPGNTNTEEYKTVSNIKIFDSKTNKLIESKFERSTFDLSRQVFDINDEGLIQLKYWVSNLKGDADLLSMGFPPIGTVLLEVIDSKANVLAVKDYPSQTIFYVPRVSLPEKEVKAGDSWAFKKLWRSMKTGWPFEIDLTMKLENWVDCGGLRCAEITYEGSMGIPEGSGIEEKVKLQSDVKGEMIYAPVGHQFIWASSSSKESISTNEKTIKVKSCTVSYQTSPDKETKKFNKKFKNECN